jgi:hypothetical protein
MSTPHIAANPGDIAQTVLLPGDPLRAKVVAETFLENPVCFNTSAICSDIPELIMEKRSQLWEPAWAWRP